MNSLNIRLSTPQYPLETIWAAILNMHSVGVKGREKNVNKTKQALLRVWIKFAGVPHDRNCFLGVVAVDINGWKSAEQVYFGCGSRSVWTLLRRLLQGQAWLIRLQKMLSQKVRRMFHYREAFWVGDSSIVYLLNETQSNTLRLELSESWITGE